MKKTLFALLAAALLSVGPALAGDLKFSSLLGDNMVLQQQTEARIWGTAARGATVRVSASWLPEALSAKADARGGRGGTAHRRADRHSGTVDLGERIGSHGKCRNQGRQGDNFLPRMAHAFNLQLTKHGQLEN